jgi:hypothetical protein
VLVDEELGHRSRTLSRGRITFRGGHDRALLEHGLGHLMNPIDPERDDRD